MSDPRGVISFEGSLGIRHLEQPLVDTDFLYSPLAIEFVREGKLVPYEHISPLVLHSPRLPFVTYPFEWTNLQLWDAAVLTLEIAQRALPVGCELRDASAWNVIFDGCRPAFCDHLSFAPISSKTWHAFGQFVRHFVLPLAVSNDRRAAADLFKLSRDGIEPWTAKDLMGMRRFVHRTLPLLYADRVTGDNRPGHVVFGQAKSTYHKELMSFLRWQMNGVLPKNRSPRGWAKYVDMRKHYSSSALEVKKQAVARWIADAKPAWVLDLGCNTGEFTAIAAASGAQVIALDSDWQSVETLYAANRGSPSVSPVYADVCDWTGGRGWLGMEFPGLADRLRSRSDLVMALGLLHHLLIANAVPVAKVAKFVSACSKRYAVVEFLDSADPMVQMLCSRFQRDPGEFRHQVQEEAFLEHFQLSERVQLPGSFRQLCLMEKRQ